MASVSTLEPALSRKFRYHFGVRRTIVVVVIVAIAGVAGALAWYWAVRDTRFRFLFERPDWARLRPAQTPYLQPAE